MLKKSQFADLDEVFRVEVVKNKKHEARVIYGYAIYNDAETAQDLNGFGHCFAYGIHSPAEFILSYLESYYIKMPLKTDRKLLRINSVYKPFCKI